VCLPDWTESNEREREAERDEKGDEPNETVGNTSKKEFGGRRAQAISVAVESKVGGCREGHVDSSIATKGRIRFWDCDKEMAPRTG
jgi:hypothetical protein